MRIRHIPVVVALVILFSVWTAYARDPDSSSDPGSTSSYTLEDIYNRLDTGAAGAQSTFTEPSSGPGTGTSHTLNEIMGKAPAADNTVDSLVATSSAVTVTIRNAGTTAINDTFWVDVYFNPTETPTVNHQWDAIASHGVVWGVTTSIPAGGSLVLTTGGDYYFPEYSRPATLAPTGNVAGGGQRVRPGGLDQLCHHLRRGAGKQRGQQPFRAGHVYGQRGGPRCADRSGPAGLKGGVTAKAVVSTFTPL